MKCPNCNAEVTSKFCSYCGSEMPKEQNSKTVNGNVVINNYYGNLGSKENVEIDKSNLLESSISKIVFYLSILYFFLCFFMSGFLVPCFIFILLLSFACLFEKNKSHRYLKKSFFIVGIGTLIFIILL